MSADTHKFLIKIVSALTIVIKRARYEIKQLHGIYEQRLQPTLTSLSSVSRHVDGYIINLLVGSMCWTCVMAYSSYTAYAYI